MDLLARICALSLLAVLTGAYGEDYYWDSPVTDPNGTLLTIKNITGCHNYLSGYNLGCDGNLRIAPVSYVFYLRNPHYGDQDCRSCVPDCDENCCSYNQSTDCKLNTHPTKDLLDKIKFCSILKTCAHTKLGWIPVMPNNNDECNGWGQEHTIYAYAATLNYYCLDDNWSVDFTNSQRKTGKALFLRASNFYKNSGFYNLTCELSADTGATIDIRALDFRLCTSLEFTDADNTHSCGQIFYIIDGSRGPPPTTVTPNSENGWMSLKPFYHSQTNNVTLKLDSGMSGFNFSLWFYIKPSRGDINIVCQDPHYYTTTTTTTTTTPSPRTSARSTQSPPSVSKRLTFSTPQSTAAKSTPEKTIFSNEIGMDDVELLKQTKDTQLLYTRMEVTGIAALLAVFLLYFVFKCYTWHKKQRRYKHKQKQRGSHDGQVQLPGNKYPNHMNLGFAMNEYETIPNKRRDYKSRPSAPVQPRPQREHRPKQDDGPSEVSD